MIPRWKTKLINIIRSAESGVTKTSFQRMRMFLSKTGGSSKFLLVSFWRYLFSSMKNLYKYWWLEPALQNIGGLRWLCIPIYINISVHAVAGIHHLHTLSFSIKRLILFYIIIFHKKPVLTSCMYLFLIFFSKSFLLCLYLKDFLFEFKNIFPNHL